MALPERLWPSWLPTPIADLMIPLLSLWAALLLRFRSRSPKVRGLVPVPLGAGLRNENRSQAVVEGG